MKYQDDNEDSSKRYERLISIIISSKFKNAFSNLIESFKTCSEGLNFRVHSISFSSCYVESMEK